jgi:hypothetical protein
MGRLGVIYRLTLKVIGNPSVDRTTDVSTEDKFLVGGGHPTTSTTVHGCIIDPVLNTE